MTQEYAPAPERPSVGQAAGMSGPLALLFSVACGLAVANVYFAQPLLEVIADDFRISYATIGVVITVTQIGYGLGLLLIVPLGDLLNRRRLVVGQSVLSALALLAVTLAPTGPLLLAGMAAVGVLAVVTQVLVAYSAFLARPADRGRVVGTVTSGIIIGILLARTISGGLADLAGWRSVYAVSSAATLVMAAFLFAALPRDVARARIRYPVLITRAVLALLIFTAIMVLLTPLALPLSGAPWHLSTTQIGLFGLAGAAGALAASYAGRQSDRGHAQRTTGIGLAVMLGSWLPIALLPHSLWGLIVGVLAIDYGLQSVHVANQSLIYRVRPEAQSRLTAGYMIFYSIGCAIGSIGSTLVYAWAGWTGVCVLGGAVSLGALIFWALTRHSEIQRLG